MKYLSFSFFLSLVLTVVAAFFQVSSNPNIVDFRERVEAVFYDVSLRLSLPPKPPELEPPIIICDIDERSLQVEGRWPWSRAKLARLIQRLLDAGAVVVALDMVLSEEEVNPVDTVLNNADTDAGELTEEWLLAQRDSLDADKRLAEALGQGDIVLGYLFHHKTKVEAGTLPDTGVQFANRVAGTMSAIPDMVGYTTNLPGFQSAALASGFVSVLPDIDGGIRKAPLLLSYQDAVYPSLSLEAARLYLVEDKVTVETAQIDEIETIISVNLGGNRIPTDGKGRMLIPYRGGRESFPYVSATDLLRGNAQLPRDGGIVLVGTSAVGLSDLRPTPMEPAFPGVEVHANVIQGLLHPELISVEPDWRDGAVVLAVLVLGIFMSIVYPQLSPVVLPIFAVVLTTAILGFNWVLWTEYLLSLSLVTPLLLMLAVTLIFLSEGLIKEYSQKRRIRHVFDSYVPPEHINTLIKGHQMGGLEGERREMTVLFSDIRNFTNLSEGLTSQELKGFLNAYLTPITEIIFARRGTIDKYVGDMVMAFWNAPLDDPQHASNAVRTGLSMIRRTREMQAQFESMGIHGLAIGVGINTGEMNVGDMGSRYRLAYTVLGDAVNLGSRLEGLTKFYGVSILMSESTRQQCADIKSRRLDRVRVKGKKEPVDIFEPLDDKAWNTPEAAEELQQYEVAIEDYFGRNFEKAEAGFLSLRKLRPEAKLYVVYEERLQKLRKDPPGTEWDGVFTHTAK